MPLLNLHLPTSWQQLSAPQLRFVFRLLSMDFTLPQIKTLCLLKWAHLKVERKEGQDTVVSHDGKEYPLTANQLYEATATLNYLGDIPKYPVRLSWIGLHRAVRADLQELPFSDYIILDNLYQGYLQTRQPQILEEMAQTLYQSDHIRLTKAEAISIFYWFAAVKQLFATTFTSFFKATSWEGSCNTPTYDQLRDIMNAQIRALTNGDITKEEAVLKMDCWRALTELNAKARDYEEIKSSHHL